MIRAIGFIIKFAILSIFILIVGNWLRIGNHTISDQIKTEIAHAEHWEFTGKIRNWAEQVTHDTRQGHKRKVDLGSRKGVISQGESEEMIAPSERQKLRNLIEELNRPSGR